MGETKLLQLKPETTQFTANGKEFVKEGTISITRWKLFLKLQIKFALGQTPEELIGELRKIYEAGNSRRDGDVCMLARDAMTGVAMIIEGRQPVMLEICALFINRPDENRKVITQDMIDQKIADWEEEGIDVVSFFQFALSSIPGLLAIYNAITQGTSQLDQSIVRNAEKKMNQSAGKSDSKEQKKTS